MTIATRSAPAEQNQDSMLVAARGLFYAATFCIPLTAVRGGFGLPLSDVLLIGAAYPAVINLAHRQVAVPRPLLLAGIFSTLALIDLSADPSRDTPENTGFVLRLVFVFVLWPALAGICLFDRGHIWRTAVAFSLGSGLSAAVGLLQVLGVDLRSLFLAEAADFTQNRYIGLNGQPNGQAGTLALAVLVCLVGYLESRRRWYLLVGLILTAGIAVSGSITGAISLVLGVALLLVRRGRLAPVLQVGVASAVALLGLMWLSSSSTFDSPLDRIDSATGQTGISTVQTRADSITFAWERIKAEPLHGVGFSERAAGTYDGVTQVHNMPLLAWYQGGILLLLAVVVAAGAAVVAAWRRKADPVEEALAVASLIALFFAQTGPALVDRYVWIFPILLLVLRQRDRRLPRGRRDRATTSGPRAGLLTGGPRR